MHVFNIQFYSFIYRLNYFSNTCFRIPYKQSQIEKEIGQIIYWYFRCSKTDICKIKLRRAPTPHDNIEYADCDKNVKKIIIFSIAAKAANDNNITMYQFERNYMHPV